MWVKLIIFDKPNIQKISKNIQNDKKYPKISKIINTYLKKSKKYKKISINFYKIKSFKVKICIYPGIRKYFLDIGMDHIFSTTNR